MDKDVSYEQILSPQEEKDFYKEQNFIGITEEGSFVPTRTLKILPLIKKNYQYIYYTTQSGAQFGWNTFLWEVINSVCMATVLCLVGYNVFAGTVCMHKDGYNSDFWMASFGIYCALVFGTTAVIMVRTSQFTWLYFLVFIILLSMFPFFFLCYLFDTVLITTPNFKEYVMINLSETYQYYLFFIFFTALSVAVEVSAILFRSYYRPTLADYFKWLIKNGKADQPEYFDAAILQNFRQLQDPIPKKITVDWSEVLSRSHVEEKVGDSDKDPLVEPNIVISKQEDTKSLMSVEATTNFHTKVINPHEQSDKQSQSTIILQKLSLLSDAKKSGLFTAVEASTHKDKPSLDYTKPRRISSRDLEVPLPAKMPYSLDEGESS